MRRKTQPRQPTAAGWSDSTDSRPYTRGKGDMPSKTYRPYTNPALKILSVYWD